MTPPAETGLYLAKSGTHKWYDLVVEIKGKAPFFSLTVFSRVTKQVHENYDPSNIKEWSDKLSD